MRVLGIESSCDDTGVALYDNEQGLIDHLLASQLQTHQPFGGVVPELAARDHIRQLIPLINKIIDGPNNTGQLPDAIAYTKGPGLAGALLVGASVGSALAYAWDIPKIGVHHMEGHLVAPMLEKDAPTPPFIALLVSGGHTMLVDVKTIGHYKILGQTLDDAVGEAFDKTAKMLGLPYPGGPSIAKAALHGNKGQFEFPKPMTNRPGLDFSFSGLKTFALTTAQAQSQPLSQQAIADIAYAFQEAATQTLMIKCQRALDVTGYKQLLVAGGVGANQQLRAQLSALTKTLGVKTFYPRPEFCTDNGAMIAYAGCLRLSNHPIKPNTYGFSVRPRWSLASINLT